MKTTDFAMRIISVASIEMRMLCICLYFFFLEREIGGRGRWDKQGRNDQKEDGIVFFRGDGLHGRHISASFAFFGISIQRILQAICLDHEIVSRDGMDEFEWNGVIGELGDRLAIGRQFIIDAS